MSAALPSKGQYITPEGTPTLVNSVNMSKLPPPPIRKNKSSFDLNSWLKSNNLSKIKHLFVKHNMTTYNSITTSNTHFALLISEKEIIESNILSNVVIAIQKLHVTHRSHSENDIDETTDDNDTDYNEEDEAQQEFNTEFVVISPDEHQVLTSLKQSLFEMNKIKIQLNEIQTNYIENKNKTENNKLKCIEKCKEKINATFWNLNEIITNRQQYLLHELDEMHLKQLNLKNNKIIEINFNDINNEIEHHEKYINNKINEYKSLIENTKSSYNNFENIDVINNDTKKVRVRRHSIIKMGYDTQNLHKRQTRHIVGEFSKIKQSINNELMQRNIDFILDENYLNNFLIYMQNKFGLILENIPVPNIKNISFELQGNNKLIIELNDNDNDNDDDIIDIYQVLRYEIAYYYKYQPQPQKQKQEKEKEKEEKEEEEEKSCDSASSELFIQNITEGGDKKDENMHKNEDILWKLTEIETNNKYKISVKIARISQEKYNDSKCVEFIIKIRSFLMDKTSKCKFWSVYSDDFVINFDEIVNGSEMYGTPKNLPKYTQTPTGSYDEETDIYNHMHENENDEKMEEFEMRNDELFFEKFYNANVFDPNYSTENSMISVLIHDESISPIISPTNAINFNAINALNEDDEKYEISQLPTRDMILKNKKKTRHRKSWSHSLNRRLSGLFTSNSNNNAIINTINTYDNDVGVKIENQNQNQNQNQSPKLKLSKKQQKKLKKQAKKEKKRKKKHQRSKSNVHSMDQEKKGKKGKKKRKQSHVELLKSNNDESDTFKILLLGGLASGKTTVFKQLKNINANGNGFDQRQKKDFRILIYSQILDSFIDIIDKIDELREDKEYKYNEHNKYYINYQNKTINNLVNYVQNKLTANEMLKCVKSGENINKIKRYLSTLWKLNGIQNVYIDKRNEIENISDSMSYFMNHNNFERILSYKYIPSMRDILLTRKRTIGINKTKLNLDIDNLCIDVNNLENKTSVTICDVGGANMEQKKWVHNFIGVTAIIYVVSLSSFDEKYPNYETYQLKQEFNVFNKYINCNQLKTKQWILFLNKIDLFVNKIKCGKTINICFNHYNDDDDIDKNIDNSIKYISKRFSLANKGNNKLYTHVTCAIEKKFMEKVVDDTFHIIINYSMLNNNSMH